MRKLACLLFVCLAVCMGCGESPKEKLGRECKEANSACWVLSRQLAAEPKDKDGWLSRPETQPPFDPWGQQLRVEYVRKGAMEYVYVHSNGPDKLPGTNDDIGQRGSHKNEAEYERMRLKNRDNRETAIEGATSATTRGLTRGVIEGVKKGVRGDPTKGRPDPTKGDR